ncbi:MAG TPA: protein translocase subunit SecF [Streptosporangiaceae bacterium]|nr:protein translocase subunit SecF [Streptosporangiaceae bacterium]
MSRLRSIGGRLYRGEVSFDFVGRQRLWYSISGLILVLSLVGLFARGLNFTVDFKGGSVFQFSAPSASITQVRSVVSSSGGGSDAIVQQVGSGTSARWEVQTGKLPYAQQTKVQNAISHDLGVPQSKISASFVGPSWGSQISQKALEALIAFLVVVVIYLSIAFEWRMAAAALTALVHDIVITIGVYALAGFQVSPATVIGLLTILGYSLYDTVVVFDKVRENTAGLLSSGRSTYSQAANLALNQTLVRSINTSLIALLPVAAILFVGGGLLGAGELNDLALVLFIGMLSGTYSSICIATPVLADLKERDPQYQALAKRVALRAAGGRAAKRAAAKAPRAAVAGGAAAGAATVLAADGAAAADIPEADVGEDDETTPAPGEKVPAGRAAPRPPGPGARGGPRQQPRRTNSAKRRPGGKKKRR